MLGFVSDAYKQIPVSDQASEVDRLFESVPCRLICGKQPVEIDLVGVLSSLCDSISMKGADLCISTLWLCVQSLRSSIGLESAKLGAALVSNIQERVDEPIEDIAEILQAGN